MNETLTDLSIAGEYINIYDHKVTEQLWLRS